MSKWQVGILLTLVAAPLLFLAGAGAWWLWREGWMVWVWWPMATCLATAYVVGAWWQRRARSLQSVNFENPVPGTSRDQQAWELIRARALRVKEIEPKRLLEIQFYLDTAQEMALDLARFYHPRAQDPLGSLTIPEILAVVELAAHDLAEMTNENLPGGHLLTINDWRRASQIVDWYQHASNVYWAVSAVFSPLNTAIRYAASKVGLNWPLQVLQENLLAWFYTAFVHRVGTYLIVLNSGRLRVGAKRYRELLARMGMNRPEAPGGPTAYQEVTLCVVGQVKTGKSSLVNAILGDNRAAADVLPLTKEIARYQFQPPNINSRLVLIDTVGYGHAGAKADQLNATRTAIQQSDLVLLVLHAHDPARQTDVELLDSLTDWFRSHPDLKMPPILGVLTHIDLLSPVLDWTPPYHWIAPLRPKEKSIQEAVVAAKEQFGSRLIDIVPACAAEGKVYGVSDWLIPRAVESLDEARAVSLLRCLYAEADTGKIRKVLSQLLQASKQLLHAAKGVPHPSGSTNSPSARHHTRQP
jgi:hypothetical protein